ncbi:MAG: cyclic nucleotide-binding domain-containing protein [Acidobacteriota bacterium]
MESLEKLLAAHAFLRDLSTEHVRFMTGCARNVRFDAGALVLEEGKEADVMFLVREGRVALEIHVPGRGPERVETVGPGDVLGWSWLFPPYRWHIDGRAMETVRAFAFDGACLRAKMEADHDLGFAVSKRLLYQVHQRLERVRLQQLDVYASGEAR